MPKISVIVPVYNVEKYLNRCVDSILAQTFSDFDLILIDDGSPDNCGKICDDYADKDNRIHVIHQENGGLSAARNAGIDWAFANSDSEWITFVDSDDWVHHDYLKALYSAVINNNSNLSYCQLCKIDSYSANEQIDFTNQFSSFLVSEDKLKELFYTSKLYGSFACGRLIKKEVIKETGYFTQGRIYEDSALTCKWFYYSKQITEVACPLYYYYVNNNGLMRSKFSYKQLDILWSKKEQIKFYESVQYYSMCKTVASSYIISAANCYKQTRSVLHDKKSAKNIKKETLLMIFKYKQYFHFTQKEAVFFLDTFYPKIGQTYWLFNTIASKLKKTIFNKQIP